MANNWVSDHSAPLHVDLSVLFAQLSQFFANRDDLSFQCDQIWRFIAKPATFGGLLATRILPWRQVAKSGKPATFENSRILLSKTSKSQLVSKIFQKFSDFFRKFWKLKWA